MIKAVRDVLKQISQSGIAILLVEHNPKVAMSIADRVYLMGKAHIGYCGPRPNCRPTRMRAASIWKCRCRLCRREK